MQISESQVGRAVRTQTWKYAVRAEANGWEESSADVYFEDFLYDLVNDPYERNNLVADVNYAEVRQQMAALLIRHMQAAGESTPKIYPQNCRPVHTHSEEK